MMAMNNLENNYVNLHGVLDEKIKGDVSIVSSGQLSQIKQEIIANIFRTNKSGAYQLLMNNPVICR